MASVKKVIYVWLVRVVSWLAHFNKNDQVIYLMSFADNLDFIQQLNQRVPGRLTVYYLPSAATGAAQLAQAGIATRPFHDSVRFALTGIPVITRAADVYLDNYYGFTAGLTRQAPQRLIQLWHAAGAVKTFGWGDPQTAQRPADDRRRFQTVYDQITDYVVGSEKMGAIFAASYHVPQTRMRVLGYPRSDRYCKSDWVMQTATAIYQKHPAFKQQEVILYAPTYRAGVQFALPADFKQLKLRPDQHLIIKLHPHLAEQERDLQARYPDLVTLVPEFSTDELLTVANTLVSDYSSVVFDYALLPNCQKIVFYVFDWDHYEQEVGLQADFRDWAPGPLVRTVVDLNHVLAMPGAPLQLTQFNQLWNTRNDGHAIERTLAYFYPRVTTTA
ncbi:CDP-glycerol glycerophosphotransferase family protein [Lactiplantibacillus plantarum]|uniref:CDP-glycerol glycerophosphotransferase family protein n=1 Tax=Lactiplantibacillus plantarum TaxID=1590 RepID=UPI0027389F37|nr:CDP-glycerol glycerophosphotransferase family protein [Lactiplantibacillus plantarum]MDP4435070.1 CDP-glycerol glycerophosphotransferase family protein [Lactiplantibacillus plantarum]MDP4438196.1 CDP-glycerol glycerophosphotransferase family protein [Lactiplantibacillus plantarum]MDP4456615.1 CDP-glycerol glycerophosphotransferase family protein [Lactiplantibacillus plantarum]